MAVIVKVSRALLRSSASQHLVKAVIVCILNSHVHNYWPEEAHFTR